MINGPSRIIRLYTGISYLWSKVQYSPSQIHCKSVYTSAVEARHSEVLKGTISKISCEVKGLTKELDKVIWEKPNSGGAITHGVDGYKIDRGIYEKSSHSQTTILTVPARANNADFVFICVITSREHGKTSDETYVNSYIFSECHIHYFVTFIALCTLILLDSGSKQTFHESKNVNSIL